MKHSHLSAFVLISFLVIGCSPIEPFRTANGPGCVKDITEDSDSCSNQAFYEITNSSNSAFISIVEYDDQGYLMNPEGYYQNLEHIRFVHAETGATVILFAHGWKHNAKSTDSNLLDFERLLLEMNSIETELCQGEACEGRRTVGVYLAWRGLSAELEPFKTASFWNRKKSAHRVGQDGAAALISDLAAIEYEVNREKPLYRFVAIGHSFGAALVYTAVQQGLVSDQSIISSDNMIPASQADIVILINPAVEAARFANVRDRSARISFPPEQDSILAVFTSLDDTATKRAFPLGRWFSTIFTKYNKDYPDQPKANRTSIGHYEGYRTHELKQDASPPEEHSTYAAFGSSDFQLNAGSMAVVICDWLEFQQGKTHTWRSGELELIRDKRMQRPGQYANPYLNVAVDPAIIGNHNDIWGESFRTFLYSFIAAQRPGHRVKEYCLN